MKLGNGVSTRSSRLPELLYANQGDARDDDRVDDRARALPGSDPQKRPQDDSHGNRTVSPQKPDTSQ